ncbi:MAG: AI-2E family transporter [Roseateles depolymerans]|uniref:AI-2E family transporter n=1 Tax=Roseateles depolymerans TaxID=76731 RepID=A0A2W5DCU5_9BURK|nr:MAG: AI-2E family transporter [Roseateles depolymerans]
MTPPALNPAPTESSVALPLKILAGTALLGFLYLARDVLIPVVLALMLGFALAPVVRRIRRLGLGQTAAALAALSLSGAVMFGVGSAVFSQVGTLAGSLPSYEANVRAKVAAIRALTIDRIAEAKDRAGRLIGEALPEPAPEEVRPAAPAAPHASTPAPSAAAADDAASLVAKALGAIWGPLGMLGVVVLVLIFVLLEQDSLRDRLIRLVGGQDLRGATNALNDAGERLSRYFVSQFAVNLGVALVVGVVLALLGLPQAAVWALLAGVLRFIPYVGFPAAAACAAGFAAAVDPGWHLVYVTLLVFVVVELLVANVVEPQLYGHTTGLSPFSVVVSAVAWGALWGPVGLLLSTPLTLCLVVAGRHVPALAFFDILFGDAPALTLSQRFYQRCLSGDAVEILAEARNYLRRRSLASYCDKIVMPALELARGDFEHQLISADQQRVAQQVVAQVFEELAHESRPARRRRVSVLDDGSLGLTLRDARVQAAGRWQGSLNVAPGSVTLCVSTSGVGSQLVAELLARALRADGVDARHVTLGEMTEPPDGARADVVGTMILVPAGEPAGAQETAQLSDVLTRLSAAHLLLLRHAFDRAMPVDRLDAGRVHRTVYSFEEALALVKGDRLQP